MYALKLTSILAGGCLALGTGGQAGANDSSAELGAGGIRLVPNWDIVMQREDLYLSPEQVGIRYVFRNTTDEPVSVLVAFPLPPIDMSELFEVPVAIPSPQSANFVGFEIAVNGQRVDAQVEQRAIAQGIDRTELLNELKIPLNPFSEQTLAALAAVDPDTSAELRRIGVGHSYEPHDPLSPLWTLETVFYWEQEFAPKADTVIEHRYHPVVGQAFLGTSTIESNDPVGYVADYCIDAGTQAAIRKRIKETNGDYMIERRLSYILTTARNWQGPIGEFRLIIDKLDPSWLVSLCLDGLRKIGPTQFEFTAKDFAPQEDLRILFLEPAKP